MRHPQHWYSHNSVVICERSVRSAIGGRNWEYHGSVYGAIETESAPSTHDGLVTRSQPTTMKSANQNVRDTTEIGTRYVIANSLLFLYLNYSILLISI